MGKLSLGTGHGIVNTTFELMKAVTHQYNPAVTYFDFGHGDISLRQKSEEAFPGYRKNQ